MNFSELSDLVQVTTHLKNVINSAGYTKFKPETISVLKKRLVELDELFISEMMIYDSRNSSKMMQDAILDARQKMGLDDRYPVPTTSLNKLKKLAESTQASVTEKKHLQRNAVPVDDCAVDSHLLTCELTSKPSLDYLDSEDAVTPKSVESKSEDVESKKEVTSTKKVSTTSVNQPYLEDESLAQLLAVEKQKAAVKKRK